MKNTKIKGFSLAEVMIAMLVISIALAAAIPTITKRNAGSDNIWRAGTQTVGGATEEDANTLSFTGPNILIGTSRLPLLSGLDNYFDDITLNKNLGGISGEQNYKFLPKNDKLIIFNKIDEDADRFKSSHIGFYNDSDEYAGRLASDKYNLALGIGALQSLQPDYSEAIPQGAYNTAIGHYALLTNQHGSYNTAFGYNALNGAIPLTVNESLINLAPLGNVAIGDNALRHNNGNYNIAIGSHAGKDLLGSNNIVIGAGAGNKLTGSNNILITAINDLNPQNMETQFDVKSLLRGSRSIDKYPIITDNDNFAIGVLNRNVGGKVVPPIMQGFTKTQLSKDIPCSGAVDGICHAKGLIINTDKFNVKNSDGTKTIFSILNNSSPITLFNNTEAPCNGAPICLAKFKIRSASFYSYNTWSGIANNDYIHREDQPILYGPGFSEDPDAKVLIPQGRDTYDLFIGSTPSNYIGFNGSSSSFGSINTLNAEVVTSGSGSSKVLVESGDTENLIDVGQRRHSAGLNYSQVGESQFSVRLALNKPESHYSLQIRTVKTAVNFLDDFKENADPIYKWRNKADDILKCFFGAFINGTVFDKKQNCLNNQTNSTEESQDYPTLFSAMLCRSHPDWKICDPTSFTCKYILFWMPICKSDARLKNISGDNTAGLKEINKLQVYNYTYKADKAKTPHVGVVAQELMTVFPDAVKKGSDGYYRIRLEDMFYAMINSVKELSKKKDELNALTVDYIDTPLSELEKQNADIKAQNELLKQKNEEIEKRLSKIEIK